MRSIPLERPFSLQNDGELELLFLGVGTAFAEELGHTNFLIVKGDDHLLVDFGSSGPDRLRHIAGLSPLDIRNFLPTHAHADHVGGMEALTVYNRYGTVLRDNGPKLNVVATRQLRNFLWQMTLRGGLGFNEQNMDGREELFDLYYQHILPRSTEEDGVQVWRVEVGSISIELFETAHVQGSKSDEGSRFPSYGMVIDDYIYFSGDTVFNREQIERYADRVAYLFHDTSIPASPLHAGLDQLRGLDPSIRSRMFLVHYPEGASEIDVRNEFAGWTEPGVRYQFQIGEADLDERPSNAGESGTDGISSDRNEQRVEN